VGFSLQGVRQQQFTACRLNIPHKASKVGFST
jgi:hypothetical protein